MARRGAGTDENCRKFAIRVDFSVGRFIKLLQHEWVLECLPPFAMAQRTRSFHARRLDIRRRAAYNNAVSELPEVCASLLFLPTFHITEPASGLGCHAPVPSGMPGDGRETPQGTGLLYIAGEKTGDSGTLGLTTFVKKAFSRGSRGCAGGTAPSFVTKSTPAFMHRRAF